MLRPDPQAEQVDAYVDGSLLDAEHDLHGLCARQGWSIAAYDLEHRLVAAAHGRTPPWADGIHATELWGLLMAVQSFDPACTVKVDCAAVQLGSKRDSTWANAPSRSFGRAWGPISSALADDPERVAWMPAHSTATSFIGKRLSNGQPVRAHDVTGNDLVDGLAKKIARRDAMPRCQVRLVRQRATRLREAAIWIGRATAYANHCPLDALVSVDPIGKRRFVRDSDGIQSRRARVRKRKVAASFESWPCQPDELQKAAVVGLAPSFCRSALPAASLTPAIAAWNGNRAKRARLAQHLDGTRNEAQLLNWLDSRPPARYTAEVSAAERLAALRGRIAQRCSR